VKRNKRYYASILLLTMAMIMGFATFCLASSGGSMPIEAPTGHTPAFGNLYVIGWSAVNFFILLALLYKFAYGPIYKMLDERTASIEDFIMQAESREGDFFYALTSKEINEKKFPGVLRTYVQLKEGVFTGGNLFLMRSRMIEPALDMALQLTMRRKNPVAMGRLFGFRLVLNYLLKRLSIPMVEKRFYEIMKIKGRGIISNYAEVGVDVDKLSDLELAEKYLGSG
jgi:hypothetical protein